MSQDIPRPDSTQVDNYLRHLLASSARVVRADSPRPPNRKERRAAKAGKRNPPK